MFWLVRRQRLFARELQHGVKTVKLRHLQAKKGTYRTNSAYFDYYQEIVSELTMTEWQSE